MNLPHVDHHRIRSPHFGQASPLVSPSFIPTPHLFQILLSVPHKQDTPLHLYLLAAPTTRSTETLHPLHASNALGTSTLGRCRSHH
jgi:hypothetical protein